MSNDDRRRALVDVRSLAKANAHIRKAWLELIEFREAMGTHTPTAAAQLVSDVLPQLEAYTNRFPDVYVDMASAHEIEPPEYRDAEEGKL